MSDMRMLAITVRGTPGPQGSKNVNKHGAVYESSAKVKPWREAVIAAADDVRGDWGMLTGPMTLAITFYFQRPKGHYGTGRNASKVKPSAPVFPAGKPDLSKLIRSTEDALTDAGIWRDDAQVINISAAKYYSPDDFRGAYMTITALGKGETP